MTDEVLRGGRAMARVGRFKQRLDAELVLGILEQHGIAAEIDFGGEILGRAQQAQAYVNLLVPSEAYTEARAVLDGLASAVAQDESVEHKEAELLPPVDDAPQPEEDPAQVVDMCSDCGGMMDLIRPPKWPVGVLGMTLLLSPVFFRVGPMGRWGWLLLVILSAIYIFNGPGTVLRCRDCGQEEKPPKSE